MGMRSTLKGAPLGGSIQITLGVFNLADRRKQRRAADVVIRWEPGGLALVAGSPSEHPDGGEVVVAADRVTWKDCEVVKPPEDPELFRLELRGRGGTVEQDLVDGESGESLREPHDEDVERITVG